MWLCWRFLEIFPAFWDIFMTLNSYKPTRLRVNVSRPNMLGPTRWWRVAGGVRGEEIKHREDNLILFEEIWARRDVWIHGIALVLVIRYYQLDISRAIDMSSRTLNNGPVISSIMQIIEAERQCESCNYYLNQKQDFKITILTPPQLARKFESF